MEEMLTIHNQLISCPNCGTPIYQMNQHTCEECGARVCYYCEAAHADTHTNKENNTDGK